MEKSLGQIFVFRVEEGLSAAAKVENLRSLVSFIFLSLIFDSNKPGFHQFLLIVEMATRTIPGPEILTF
jgi:hypothetical protein